MKMYGLGLENILLILDKIPKLNYITSPYTKKMCVFRAKDKLYFLKKQMLMRDLIKKAQSQLFYLRILKANIFTLT